MDQNLMNDNNELNIKELIKTLLFELGENSNREGLLKTPERVSKAWKYLVRGYDQDLSSVINNAIFNEEYDEMVTVNDIDFFSSCEHHLLPFFGKAHVAYIPNGKIIGLSKIPRIVDMFGRRLQVQERMTHQIAEAINQALSPKGVAVVIEGTHMCMQMRGVQKQNSFTTTSSMIGQFRKDSKTRDEFLKLISIKR